jgi:hypothetical protein
MQWPRVRPKLETLITTTFRGAATRSFAAKADDRRPRLERPTMAKNLKRPWTAKDDQLLRKLAEANASTALIAAKLMRSVMAVRAHASILKISLRKVSKSRANKAAS